MPADIWRDDPHALHGNRLMRVQLNLFAHYRTHADLDIYIPLTDTR